VQQKGRDKGTSDISLLGAEKLQSAPGAHNPRYATVHRVLYIYTKVGLQLFYAHPSVNPMTL